jgi:hypothetical protein
MMTFDFNFISLPWLEICLISTLFAFIDRQEVGGARKVIHRLPIPSKHRSVILQQVDNPNKPKSIFVILLNPTQYISLRFRMHEP